MTIVREAFTPEAGIGGVIGGMLVGIQRASFSNEAGLGSAAIVQATARTDYPVRQGFVGMLGPFIDTVIVCMATALLIVVTGMHEGGQGIAGVELTSRALEQGGAWLSYVLAVAVFLFAYSTQITWFYYGEIGATYILGEKKWVSTGFKFVFLAFTVIGCAATLENVVNLTDALFLSMAFANILGLYMLAPEIKRDLKAYILQMKSS
jgi:AGCS family alanine or glycine:cation symporter